MAHRIAPALRREARRLQLAFRSLDPQTAFVLVSAVVFVFIQFMIGERQFFFTEVALHLPPEWRQLTSWIWWFGMQSLTGFVLPVLCLLVLFGRKPAAIGLGRGDWRFAAVVALAYLPLVAVGTWVLSDMSAFQETYPHYREAASDWRLFLTYEFFFLLYWIGWEYLWRGYVLFGTAHTFGLYAIFVQMIPFAILHLDKPPAEAFLSILGALALGALVWRCRSFWIAVPIHAAQMLILDVWCTLRVRTEVDGIGPAALLEMLRAL